MPKVLLLPQLLLLLLLLLCCLWPFLLLFLIACTHGSFAQLPIFTHWAGQTYWIRNAQRQRLIFISFPFVPHCVCAVSVCCCFSLLFFSWLFIYLFVVLLQQNEERGPKRKSGGERQRERRESLEPGRPLLLFVLLMGNHLFYSAHIRTETQMHLHARTQVKLPRSYL